MASGGASPGELINGATTPQKLPLSNLNPNSSLAVKICVFCGASPGKSPGEPQIPSTDSMQILTGGVSTFGSSS